MKQFFLAVIILLCLQDSFASHLVSSRNREISRLSLCPQLPSVLILESPITTEFTNYLLHYSGFKKQYQLVDRSQLGEMHASCQGQPALQGKAFVDDVFAMYIVSLEYNVKDPMPKPIHIQVMRTDNGTMLYEKKSIIGGKDFEDVTSFMDTVVPEWLEIMAKQRNDCLNTFTATIIEDVQLRCQGQLPSATTYSISSDFRLTFVIRSLDLAVRESIQSLGGSMAVLPKPARTIQSMALKHRSKTCTFTVSSQKVLDINLKEVQLPAILHLTIPANLNQPWLFAPKVISAEPFFTGDAVEINTIRTVGETGCLDKSDIKIEKSQLVYTDHNLFKFSPQEFNPFCGTSAFILPLFTRAPNLGTPITHDITEGCTRTTSNALINFKRRFYRY